MRIAWILLSLTIMLSIPSLLVLGQPPQQGASIPRHLNPESLNETSPDPAAMTLLYELIGKYMLSGNFTASNGMVKTAMNVTAPGDIGYILRRFHELLGKEVSNLNLTDAMIERIKGLIISGDYEGAYEILDQALISLERANITYMDLSEAAEAVRRRLRANTGGLIYAVGKLLTDYRGKLKEINETVSLRNLEPTELEISVFKTEAWVGSNLLVEGRLSLSSGMGLPYRYVTLVLDNEAIERVATDVDGSFSALITIPYRYVDRMRLYAFYLPEGEDLSRYMGTTSNLIDLRILYIKPAVEVWVSPRRALPTEVVRVEGFTNVTNLSLAITAFGRREQLNSSGNFSLTLMVPQEAQEGSYPIIAEVIPSGRVGPGSSAAYLNVYKLKVIIENATFPGLVVPMIPATLSGYVSDEVGNPLRNFTVIATFREYNASFTGIGEDGRFHLDINASPFSPSGYATIDLAIVPSDPIHSQATMEAGTTLVLNPILLASVAAMILLAVYLVFKLESKRRKEKKVLITKRKRAVVREKREITPPKPKPPEQESLEVVEVGDEVIREFMRALRAVERSTGVPMRPSFTIREYYSLVGPKLGEASIHFDRLCRLVELHLYGRVMVDASLVRSVAQRVIRSLGGGLGT